MSTLDGEGRDVAERIGGEPIFSGAPAANGNSAVPAIRLHRFICYETFSTMIE